MPYVIEKTSAVDALNCGAGDISPPLLLDADDHVWLLYHTLANGDLNDDENIIIAKTQSQAEAMKETLDAAEAHDLEQEAKDQWLI